MEEYIMKLEGKIAIVTGAGKELGARQRWQSPKRAQPLSL